MKNILWISTSVPYDTVRHAGGKTHNYYIKYFQKTERFHIHLVTLGKREELNRLDLDEYGISYDVGIIDGGWIKNLYRKVYNTNSVWNRRHPLCHAILSYEFQELKKRVKAYADAAGKSDIVIMQWTGAAFLLPYVKMLFPDAYTVIIEEDVAFLGYERRCRQKVNAYYARKTKDIYEKLKDTELSLLKNCSLAVVNNSKDKDLLLANGLDEAHLYQASPYYQDYSNICRSANGKYILFYGAMNREENHQAAIWFLENVFPQLEQCGIEVEIVGACPRKSLLRWNCGRVHVRGYVEDVRPYLEQCLCTVVPLQLGAGIKVKVLEAMSAAVPVLTNEVGIEGIPARDGREYFLCNTVQDYVDVIDRLMREPECGKIVGINARKMILNEFNINNRLGELIEILVKRIGN